MVAEKQPVKGEEELTKPKGEDQEPEPETPKVETPKSLTDALKALEERETRIHELNKESASRRKALKEFETADAKRKEEDTKRRDAELTEVERLKKQIAEKEIAHEKAIQEMAAMRLRNAVEREAVKLNFISPDEAYALADLTGVEVDDAGKVTGVAEALNKLSKERPHLTQAQRKSAPDLNARNGNNHQTNSEERKVELEQRFPSAFRFRGK